MVIDCCQAGSSPCIPVQYNLHYTENNSLATLTKALILINEPRTRPQSPLVCLIFAGILLKKSALHTMNGMKLFFRYNKLFSELLKNLTFSTFALRASLRTYLFTCIFLASHKQSNLFYLYSLSFAKSLLFYLHSLSFTNNLTFLPLLSDLLKEH